LNRAQKSTVEQLADAYRDARPYLDIGWFFVIAVLMFFWLGYELDEYLQKQPQYQLWGAGLGFVLGFLNLYKRILQLKRKK
jgi:F0F1-type ATP synthase assembly protein I